VLTVRLHNDGTGSNASANYDATVRVNDKLIWQGRVEGHDRDSGWPTLLRQLADAAEKAEAGA
jgi:hypothetical protein